MSNPYHFLTSFFTIIRVAQLNGSVRNAGLDLTRRIASKFVFDYVFYTKIVFKTFLFGSPVLGNTHVLFALLSDRSECLGVGFKKLRAKNDN